MLDGSRNSEARLVSEGLGCAITLEKVICGIVVLVWGTGGISDLRIFDEDNPDVVSSTSVSSGRSARVGDGDGSLVF